MLMNKPDRQHETFGDYHLIEPIATGGMAEVWRARAYGLAGFEKTLVIKKILPSLAQDDEFVRLFIDEARISVLLQHVNIVQVFDLGRAEGTLYMAMEHVAGVDLARLLTQAHRRGKMPIALALYIVTEILKALRFAHERRDEDGRSMDIVHCDISPQNVLVSFSGEVKITDFGISRAAFQASSLHDVVRGKYAYMSPEQLGNERLDGRSDLFSLGIVLWEMLCGRRLFKAKTKEETLRRVRSGEVPDPRRFRAEISEDVAGIVLRALSPRREQRYRSAADMLEALSMVMVREGHRASNHSLAAFVKDAVELPDTTAARAVTPAAAMHVVVLALEVTPARGSMGGTPPDTVVGRICDVIQRSGGAIWEREGSSLLGVWFAETDMRGVLSRVAELARDVSVMAEVSGHRAAGGVAPGQVKLKDGTQRPQEGWELAGPYYLARWMMNLSARHGRVLLTRSAARCLEPRATAEVGRIAVRDDRHIHLFELR